MEQMENYVTATGSNSKRIFDEDSVSKVTSDGEPLLTMVAGLSGLLTGIIILAVLVSMVACRNHKNKRRQSGTAGAATPTPPATITDLTMTSPPVAGRGNLNAAFAESTLSLRVQDNDKDKEWPSAVVVIERERY
ncbi:uncharacterized protein Dwil_GK19949 [Drosophila willistoni]|uniref:Uncharacterized protein n=1 Tax=Drosophila willistoni TaxID=7260 RepID=B4MSC9_DROWI|nr:uncharacterized protein LOC6641447 [Drosophila willistoni]EDW75018.1 uncharacterized protein Dwil_GK19949 [Drosophila willistoni]